MAVGARITSTNLSGKTATVTFVPYTGTTSGSTVNLGTKTVPFNNITSHPYGVYSLHFAEYDYTYTLTVPEPSSDIQLMVFTDRILDSDNYGAVVLNFTDLTADVIDLGVDATYWDNNDVYPLTNSGFMYIFNGDSDYYEKLIIFTDSTGQEIDRYTGTTDNYDAEALEGRWVSFEDEDNGVLTYSDGTSVYTYTWDPQTHWIDIEDDWYSVAGDGTFIIKKWEIGSWTYNGNGESYLVNPSDGTTTLFKTWSDGTYVRHMMQPNTDFIVVETQTQGGGGSSYTSFQIYNTSGDVLETVSLTGDTYNSRNSEFIGTNKFGIVYYNYDDNIIDYKIIHYNSETETLIETSHVRGNEYNDFNIQADNDFWANETLNGGFVITFYHSNSWTPIGYMVDYCDVVYMLRNQSLFNTYTITENNSMLVNTWGQLGSNIWRTVISTSGDIEILTISTTGGTITNTEFPGSSVYNLDWYWMDDRTIMNFLNNDYTEVLTLLIDEDGNVADSLEKTLNGGYNLNTGTQGNIGYVRYGTTTGDEGYYTYSGSTGFTSTNAYSNYDTPDTFYSETFLEPEIMVLFSEGGGTGFRVLTSLGITDEMDFPEYGNMELNVGKDKFVFVYSEPETGIVKINLYNSLGEVINSYNTETTNGWDNTWAVKDRYVVSLYNEGVYEYFLVSEDTITSVTTQDYDRERTPNDFNWWDD